MRLSWLRRLFKGTQRMEAEPWGALMKQARAAQDAFDEIMYRVSEHRQVTGKRTQALIEDAYDRHRALERRFGDLTHAAIVAVEDCDRLVANLQELDAIGRELWQSLARQGITQLEVKEGEVVPEGTCRVIPGEKSGTEPGHIVRVVRKPWIDSQGRIVRVGEVVAVPTSSPATATSNATGEAQQGQVQQVGTQPRTRLAQAEDAAGGTEGPGQAAPPADSEAGPEVQPQAAEDARGQTTGDHAGA